MREAVLILAIALQMPAVVIDRIAVIVGKHAIKLSDIERDLRLTEFLNNMPLDFSSAAKRKSAERLIDQTIIRDEIAAGGYSRATDADADSMLAEVRNNRFGGSDARLRQTLARYGLSQNELREELLWQMTVLRFIDERFRPAVNVSDQEVRDYYEKHLAALKRQYPRESSFAALESKIRDLIEGEQVNQMFDAWLDQARRDHQIEYKKEAFG